jgi:hypothetical protein
MESQKSRKARASLANVSPSDQPGHEGDQADNRQPTLAGLSNVLTLFKAPNASCNSNTKNE